MTLDNIVKDDYGQVIEITFIDTDTNAAADISGYSTAQQMIFTDPAGTSTTKTAAFKTDGTDGIIDYTVESGLFDQSGTWKVKGKVTGATAVLTSVIEYFWISD